MTLKEKPGNQTPGPIVLLTDFGNKEPFVGQMKGVMTQIAPGVEIFDLCNEVPPHNIFVGAIFLANSRSFFPPGTVFVVVVDPDVGTKRGVVLVKAYDQYFIGPNNGYFDFLIREGVEWEAVAIENPSYRLPKVSSLFFGRDVFAPAAAHLAAGAPFYSFGDGIDTLVPLDVLPPTYDGKMIRGYIIHFDNFGNAWTNITREFLEKHNWLDIPSSIYTYAGFMWIKGMSETYKSSKDKPLSLINAFNFVEIACYKDSAKKRLGLKKDAQVEMMLQV